MLILGDIVRAWNSFGTGLIHLQMVHFTLQCLFAKRLQCRKGTYPLCKRNILNLALNDAESSCRIILKLIGGFTNPIWTSNRDKVAMSLQCIWRVLWILMRFHDATGASPKIQVAKGFTRMVYMGWMPYVQRDQIHDPWWCELATQDTTAGSCRQSEVWQLLRGLKPTQ